jgi:uncharacterized iron-regulated membrane protein
VRFLIVAVMVAALAGAVAWSKRTAVLEVAEPVPASKSQA